MEPESSPSKLDIFRSGFISTKRMTEEPFREVTRNPRLRRFAQYDQDIKFKKMLGEGKQGFVFWVIISGNDYALKVFKPFDPPPHVQEYEEPVLWSCFTTFGLECRAFARLIDMGENGTFAVKCHGWKQLSTEQLAKIQRKFRIPEGELTEWALVKEKVDITAREEQIEGMVERWDIAQRATLMAGDVRPDNYGAGKFLDLGSATIWPYPRKYWQGNLLERSIINYKDMVRAWKVVDGKFEEPGW